MSASIRCRRAESISCPATTTAWMRVVLPMSASGSASSTTRSAYLPGSTVPWTCWVPRKRAGSRVAVCRARMGVSPAATHRASSVCRSKPWKPKIVGLSVPASSRTPASSIALVMASRRWNSTARWAASSAVRPRVYSSSCTHSQMPGRLAGRYFSRSSASEPRWGRSSMRCMVSVGVYATPLATSWRNTRSAVNGL